jgi:hypothetical protein
MIWQVPGGISKHRAVECTWGSHSFLLGIWKAPQEWFDLDVGRRVESWWAKETQALALSGRKLNTLKSQEASRVGAPRAKERRRKRGWGLISFESQPASVGIGEGLPVSCGQRGRGI